MQWGCHMEMLHLNFNRNFQWFNISCFFFHLVYVSEQQEKTELFCERQEKNAKGRVLAVFSLSSFFVVLRVFFFCIKNLLRLWLVELTANRIHRRLASPSNRTITNFLAYCQCSHYRIKRALIQQPLVHGTISVVHIVR